MFLDIFRYFYTGGFLRSISPYFLVAGGDTSILSGQNYSTSIQSELKKFSGIGKRQEAEFRRAPTKVQGF